MKSHLESLLGCEPSPLLSDDGKAIAKLKDVCFGKIASIDSVDWNQYSTCRGRVSKAALSKLVDVLMDDKNTFSEDDHMEAENDGLWDWICHQYRLYSVSPIFLDFALTQCKNAGHLTPSIASLASVCREVGSNAIFLSEQEYQMNRVGTLPMFRVEDVLKKHAWALKD